MYETEKLDLTSLIARTNRYVHGLGVRMERAIEKEGPLVPHTQHATTVTTESTNANMTCHHQSGKIGNLNP
jgi:nitrate reductase cytochrome c-type subunit